MRMSPPPYRPSDTLLRSRVSRPRIRFFILSWHTGPRQEATNDAILRALSPAQVRANTTRGSTPGLIDPFRGRLGGRVYRVGEGAGDDTDSEEEVEEEEEDAEGGSRSESEDDIDDLIINGARGKVDSSNAGNGSNGGKTSSQHVDDDGWEGEEVEDESGVEKYMREEEEKDDEDEDDEKEQRKRAQEDDDISDKLHDASEGPPLKRRRTESSQENLSTTDATAADFTDAFGEDHLLLQSRLGTPSSRTPSPHSPIKHAIGAHGPLGVSSF